MPDLPLIAVCEDDADIRELLAAFLAANGFAVTTAGDALALDAVLAKKPAALIVLDWMLPGEDGFSICRRLRAAGGPPIIMLTACDEDGDRSAALDGGAGDYVSKPFSPQVLLARIRAVLRRGAPAQGDRLLFADVAIHPAARRVEVGGAGLMLTAAKFDLLLSFAQAGTVRSTGQALARRLRDGRFSRLAMLIALSVLLSCSARFENAGRLPASKQANGVEPRLLTTLTGCFDSTPSAITAHAAAQTPTNRYGA